MRTIKYLSDQIYLDFQSTSPNTYSNYQIKNYGTVIFEGRVFGTGQSQRLYITDILKSYSGNFNYMFPDKSQTNDSIMSITVSMDNASISSNPICVMNMYQSANVPDKIEFNPSSSNSVSYNQLSFNTDLMPRIPNFIRTPAYGFFFATQRVYSRGYSGSRSITFNSASGSVLRTLGSESKQGNSSSRCFDSSLLNTMPFNTATIKSGGVTIANVDQCNAEFYLIWVDRSGAYQCQPFTKKNYHKENLSRKTLVNLIDEERPYQVEVADQWELNSDWSRFEDQSTFESILTSPYCYLYNTVLQRGYYVNCIKSDWIDYSRFNRTKPFQYNITVQAVNKQNLIY